jgi:hypothetical protein
MTAQAITVSQLAKRHPAHRLTWCLTLGPLVLFVSRSETRSRGVSWGFAAG